MVARRAPRIDATASRGAIIGRRRQPRGVGADTGGGPADLAGTLKDAETDVLGGVSARKVIVCRDRRQNQRVIDQ